MIILLVSKYFNDGHFLSWNIDTNFWTCVQAQSFLLNIFLLLSYTLHYPLLHRRTYSYICRPIHSPNQPHIESLTPSFTAWHAHSITRPLNYSPSHSLTHSLAHSLSPAHLFILSITSSLALSLVISFAVGDVSFIWYQQFSILVQLISLNIPAWSSSDCAGSSYPQDMGDTQFSWSNTGRTLAKKLNMVELQKRSEATLSKNMINRNKLIQ